MQVKDVFENCLERFARLPQNRISAEAGFARVAISRRSRNNGALFGMCRMDGKGRAVLLLVVTTFLWGATFSVTKLLLPAWTPGALLAVRFFLTAAMVLLISPREVVRDFGKGARSPLLWMLAVLNAVALFFQTWGLEMTTASNGGFITAFSIVLVPLLKRAHYGEKTSFLLIASLGAAMAGIYIISFSLALPREVNVGDCFVLICAICYGYYILILERLARDLSPGIIVCFTFLVGAFPCALAGGMIPSTPRSEDPFAASALVLLFLLCSLGGAVPYILMVMGQKALKAQLAALIYALEPIFATIVAVLWIGEAITLSVIVGGLLVFGGVVLGIATSNEKKPVGAHHGAPIA